MKKILIAVLLLVVLLWTVALAECAGGNPECSGGSLEYYQDGTRTEYSSCGTHPNCTVVSVYSITCSRCATCGYGGWPVGETLISEHHTAPNR